MEAIWFSAPSLLLGCIAACLLYKFFTSVTNTAKYPPGPQGISAFLTVFSALLNGGLHKQARKWREEYGQEASSGLGPTEPSTSTSSGSRSRLAKGQASSEFGSLKPGEIVLCRTPIANFCFLNSARVVRELYVNKERELVTNDRAKTFTGWFFTRHKDVVFSDTTMDPNWPRRRRLLHQAIKYYGDGVDKFDCTVQTELQRLVSSIEAKVGEDVNVADMLSYSLLSVVVILFTGSRPEPDSESVQVMKCLDECINKVFTPGTDSVLSLLPFLRFIPGTRYHEICQETGKVADKFYFEFFTKIKENYSPDQQEGMIYFLLGEQQRDPALTDENIKGLVLNILTGAYVTSFGTLKAMLLFLVHNPEVVRRIQKEVDDVIGSRLPCVADRKKLPYTEAVVMETLRHFSVLPLSVPHQLREDVVIDGYTIPKGTRVFANAWTYLHDPEIFHDPEVFRPERFLDGATGELLPITHPMGKSFLPFGIGKRSCPGENFARARIFLYTATLLQKFDILPPKEHELPPEDPELFEDGIILQPPAYHLIFRHRSA